MVYKTLTIFYHFPLRASARTGLVHNIPTKVYNLILGGVWWCFWSQVRIACNPLF